MQNGNDCSPDSGAAIACTHCGAMTKAECKCITGSQMAKEIIEANDKFLETMDMFRTPSPEAIFKQINELLEKTRKKAFEDGRRKGYAEINAVVENCEDPYTIDHVAQYIDTKDPLEKLEDTRTATQINDSQKQPEFIDKFYPIWDAYFPVFEAARKVRAYYCGGSGPLRVCADVVGDLINELNKAEKVAKVERAPGEKDPSETPLFCEAPSQESNEKLFGKLFDRMFKKFNEYICSDMYDEAAELKEKLLRAYPEEMAKHGYLPSPENKDMEHV